MAALPDRNRLHVSVVAAIEAQILSGELQVGTRLPSEAELARQFGISTRSVREALQVLATKGLVRRRHGGRTEVVRDDVGQFLESLAATVQTRFARDADYLVQLMDVRAMFEREVVGRLAAGEGRDDGAIKAALKAMTSARDFGEYADADADFHRALVHALGNDVLSTVYDSLYALIVDVIRLTSRVPSKTRDEGVAEHQAIHAAIRRGDPEVARALVREHIDNSTAYLQQAIAKQQGRTAR